MGRVCCDSNGRLNVKSLLMEGYGGRTVPMDVSQVETYSLFPGQVVVVEGENPVGNRLKAKRIYSNATLTLPPAPSLSTREHGMSCIFIILVRGLGIKS